MAFRVEVAPRAFEDLDAIVAYIRAHGSFERAEQWFNEMMLAIASLEDLPQRCPVADEGEDLGQEVRLLLHGRRNHMYKVYFSIRGKAEDAGTVQVLHIRHWAQHALSADELGQLAAEAGSELTS